MYNALAELSMVLECLQNRETTVAYADKIIRRAIAFFHCLKEKPGTISLEAKRSAIEGNFYGAPLRSNGKISAINDEQLLSSSIGPSTFTSFTIARTGLLRNSLDMMKKK